LFEDGNSTGHREPNVNDPIEITPRLQWGRIADITAFDRSRCAWEDAPAWRLGEEKARFNLAAGAAVFMKATLRE